MRFLATQTPIAVPIEPGEMLPLTASDAARMSASIVAVWVAVARIVPRVVVARAVIVLSMISALAVQ